MINRQFVITLPVFNWIILNYFLKGYGLQELCFKSFSDTRGCANSNQTQTHFGFVIFIKTLIQSGAINVDVSWLNSNRTGPPVPFLDEGASIISDFTQYRRFPRKLVYL